MNQTEIFKDLKIIELSSVLAGPAVGMFFAELGARVIKIENKNTGGDVTRKWKSKMENTGGNISSYYCSVNWNKESIFLNLKDEEDWQHLLLLIEEADILISNLKNKQSIDLKVDYHTIKKLFPSIIYGQISGYGPESNRSAYDVVLQAECGMMSINGDKGAPPLKLPIAMIDLLAAHQMKEGILIALLQKQKSTNEGAYVHVSLHETAICSLANQATNWLMNGNIPQRIGSLHPNIAPYGETFKTEDMEEVVLAIGTEKQFGALCEILGDPDLAQNPKYHTNQQRVIHRNSLYKALKKLIENKKVKDFLNRCHSLDVPVGKVNNIQQVFDQKPAKNLILEDQIDGIHTKRVKSISFSIQ